MAHRDPVHQSYLLLKLTCNGVTYRFTDWQAAVPTASGTYSPLALKVSVPPNNGTFDEKPMTVQFKSGDNAFLDSLVSGEFKAPCLLEVRQRAKSYGPIDTSGCAGQAQAINYGNTYRLMRGIKNADREPGLCRLEFLSFKGLLQKPLGIAATPRCAWSLGDKSCQFAVPADLTVTISAVSRKKVTLTNPADAVAVTGRDTGYWRHGVMYLNEEVITIRDWVNDSYDFFLLREPPAAWLGAAVKIRMGCDNTIARCRVIGNEINFGGFGSGIPAHQIVLESRES